MDDVEYSTQWQCWLRDFHLEQARSKEPVVTREVLQVNPARASACCSGISYPGGVREFLLRARLVERTGSVFPGRFACAILSQYYNRQRSASCRFANSEASAN